jgi:hypothetical protein
MRGILLSLGRRLGARLHWPILVVPLGVLEPFKTLVQVHLLKYELVSHLLSQQCERDVRYHPSSTQLTSLLFPEDSPFAPTNIAALPVHVKETAKVTDMAYKQHEALSRESSRFPRPTKHLASVSSMAWIM